MSQRLRIEHTFEVSEKGFWDTFLNTEYNKEMFEEEMRFISWDLERFDKTDTEMHRVVVVQPYIGELPGAIKKVIGEKIKYKEEGRLDRVKNSYKLKVIPGKFADKIKVSGEQFTEPLGDNRCKRVFVADIEVKIFGVGSMIEKQLANDMRKSYDVGARFTQDYMKRHGVE